jgi:hypothetical protein
MSGSQKFARYIFCASSIAPMPVDGGRTINLQPDDRLKRLKGDWRGKLAHRH